MPAKSRAAERGLRDGQEAAMLRLYRQTGPRERRAWLGALIRYLDGQPFEDAFVEAFVELGDSPAVARLKVQEAFQAAPDWRRHLN
jgi:hypothetical protein